MSWRRQWVWGLVAGLGCSAPAPADLAQPWLSWGLPGGGFPDRTSPPWVPGFLIALDRKIPSFLHLMK